MTPSIVVMLIWAGAIMNGGAAAITGFESIEACEAAKPIVAHTRAIGTSAYLDCVKLPTRIETKK